MNNRFIKALYREPTDCTPIWIMRQAGRYLPEYRALRQQVPDFMTFCRTPELACQATLQPLCRFDLDAAILFSDILTIPDAMGVGLQFVQGDGPKILKPVRSQSDVDRLSVICPEEQTAYVFDALRLIRHELEGKCPVIGFAGSPWTIATYMIEGGSSKTFTHSKNMMFKEPKMLHALLQKLTDSIIAYLKAQIEAGAEALMIFDSWGGVLAPYQYQTFSLAYMQEIVTALPKSHRGQRIPVICFSKNISMTSLELLSQSGCEAVGLDWTTSIGDAKARVGSRVALQGNLDPGVLLGNAANVEIEVKRVLDAFGEGPGHVFNLGHGITPEVDPENVAVLVDTVHQYSKRYRERK